MRILLDENMPLDFGALVPAHQVSHVEELGLKGTRNGELLALARDGFDAFISLDRGILFQHNHSGNLIVVVLRVPNSNPNTIRARSGALCNALESAKPGDVVELSI